MRFFHGLSKGLFTHNEIQPDFLLRPFILSIMGDEPILPVIQPVTINTMLNNDGPNVGGGLNFVTCERSLRLFYTKRH